MHAMLRVLLLQNALISDGKSSPDNKKGNVWIPSWTAKTKQHPANNDAHCMISWILASPVKNRRLGSKLVYVDWTYI